MKKLSNQLEFQQLYSGSLEHDVDVCIEELEAELHEERRCRVQVELDNKEYEGYIYCDKDGGRRKY